MADLTEAQQQELYRTARTTGTYNHIWQNVGKCAFCDLRDKYVFYEENGIVMTVALYAYVDGHFLIIPRRHVTSAKELTPTEWETVRKCMYMAKKLVRKVHGAKGIQYIQKEGVDAQSTVEHIHFHCIPFDGPELSTWHYRSLKHTPLDNAALYKHQTAKMQDLSQKFDSKYGTSANSKESPVP